MSNSSALHTASPSGEDSTGTTLLESYTASHTPTDQPLCVCVCVNVGMTGAPWFSLLSHCNVLAFLAYHIGAGVPTAGLQKRKGPTSPLF